VIIVARDRDNEITADAGGALVTSL